MLGILFLICIIVGIIALAIHAENNPSPAEIKRRTILKEQEEKLAQEKRIQHEQRSQQYWVNHYQKKMLDKQKHREYIRLARNSLKNEK